MFTPPPLVVLAGCLPFFQWPMHSKTRVEPSYNPQMAVESIHLRIQEESHHCHLDDVKLCQNDELRCSVSKSVSECWAVHPALPPTIHIMHIPVSRDPTCHPVCYNPTYGPSMVMGIVLGLGPEDPHFLISMPTTVMSYSPNLPLILWSNQQFSNQSCDFSDYYSATRSQLEILGVDSYVG
jgi:hypothetical protein